MFVLAAWLAAYMAALILAARRGWPIGTTLCLVCGLLLALNEVWLPSVLTVKEWMSAADAVSSAYEDTYYVVVYFHRLLFLEFTLAILALTTFLVSRIGSSWTKGVADGAALVLVLALGTAATFFSWAQMFFPWLPTDFFSRNRFLSVNAAVAYTASGVILMCLIIAVIQTLRRKRA